jgi:hypothetical protein
MLGEPYVRVVGQRVADAIARVTTVGADTSPTSVP